MVNDAHLVFLSAWGQGLIALFLSGLFGYYHRTNRRARDRLWSASFAAMVLYVAGAAWSLVRAEAGRPVGDPLRFAGMTLSLAGLHAQVAWLILGTLWARRSDAPSALLELAIVGGAALLGALIASGFALSGGDDATMLGRLAWFYLLLGVAYVLCGASLVMRRGASSFIGSAFLALGLFKLGVVALLALGDPARPIASPQTVMTFDLIGTAFAGIALAVALFEAERRRAQRAQASLTSLLRFDPITGLPNRAHLAELWPRLRGAGGALLAIELVGLERAALGIAGDPNERTLRAIADRLVTGFGIGRVAELERERFVVVLSGDMQQTRDDARAALDLVEGALDAELPTHEVLPAAGLAGFSADEELAAVIARAVGGVEQARRIGGARLVDTDRAPTARTDRVVTLRGLRGAIERREFEMQFQPIVATRSRALVGFESLVRWQHPDAGQLGSNRFVEAVERFGLITQLDRQTLALSLDAIVAWRSAGAEVPRISINFGATSLESPTLAKEVLDALAARGLETRQIAVELTESAALADLEACRVNLITLHRAGVAVSLDDFGTGFSSVAHLRDLPVDIVKLDQRFVERVDRDPRDAALVRGLAQLANSLSMSVTAEGIERETQMAFAAECGIDAVQGYLIAPPLTADRALAMIRSARSA